VHPLVVGERLVKQPIAFRFLKVERSDSNGSKTLNKVTAVHNGALPNLVCKNV